MKYLKISSPPLTLKKISLTFYQIHSSLWCTLNAYNVSTVNFCVVHSLQTETGKAFFLYFIANGYILICWLTMIMSMVEGFAMHSALTVSLRRMTDVQVFCR